MNKILLINMSIVVISVKRLPYDCDYMHDNMLFVIVIVECGLRFLICVKLWSCRLQFKTIQ